MLPLAELRTVFHYNPTTGKFIYLQHRGRRAPGQPAGSVIRGQLYLSLDGALYSAAAVAWGLTYGPWPPDHYITPRNNDPLDLRLSNLQLSTTPYKRPRATRSTAGRRAKRAAWTKCVRWSQRQQCWKVYHDGRLIDSFDTKEQALNAKREAMSNG